MNRERHRTDPARRERGVALLSVVVVLSTLLIIGILFATTVDLDLRAARYYRDAGQAELYALEGVYRAVAEIQYDMWGVDEDRAFVSADSAATLADAAYTTTGGVKITKPKSRWRRTVETIAGNNVLTDYRWIEINGPDPLRDFTHSGAVYHDEFLPEGTDNADVWELGLHVNRGDIFFENRPPRSYKSDEKLAGGLAGSFWPGKRTRPWDKEWDYVDTRINGESFYKLFRAELVWQDASDWRSTYAGVQADGTVMPKSDWYLMKTHLGNASYPGEYQTDSRGGAVNINQINNNYAFETYYAQAAPGTDYIPFHYKDSKWVYVYDENGIKRGRYAVFVSGDCGYPNANYLYDITEVQSNAAWGTLKHAADYFRILDSAYSPRGGPIDGDLAVGADIIQSNVVKGGGGGADWAEDLGRRIADHVRAHVPMTSRAELNMLIRKDGFDNSDLAALERDAEIICNLVTVHGYENLMGPHWEKDRLVIDALGFNYAADLAKKKIEPFGSRVKPSGSSYVRNSSGGQNTRRQIWHTLNELKFYWGPDEDREGRLTPYSDRNPLKLAAYPDDEHLVAKSLFLSWVTAGSFYNRNLLDKATEIAWASDVSDPAAPRFVGSGQGGPGRDPRRNDLSATTTVSHLVPAVLNEVGRINTAKLKADMGSKRCRGWEALSGGDYLFVEFVDQWDATFYQSEFSFRGNMLSSLGDSAKGAHWNPTKPEHAYAWRAKLTLYVDGSRDIFADPDTRIICLDADLDNEDGPDGYHEEDYLPKGGPNTHHLDQKRPNGSQGSGFAGQWASDPPMVVPTQDEVDAGLTCRRRLDGEYLPGGTGGVTDLKADSKEGNVIVVSFNKKRFNQNKGRYITYGGDPNDTWESWGRYLPANYMLVLFNPSKFDGKKITFGMAYAGGPDRILDYVELPGNLSAGYSCYDFLANQHPAMWVKTGNVPFESGGLATPAWRGLSGRTAYEMGGSSGDPEAWHHGLNSNAITTYMPGAESWPSPAAKVMDINGKSASGLMGSNWQDVSHVPAGHQSTAITAADSWDVLHSWGRLMACPLGFFPRPQGDVRSGTDRPDIFMRTWRDLMRVAPLEKYFALGYLERGDISKHGEYLIYDSFDNNLDGHTDNLVAKARYPGAYPAPQQPLGHYVGDHAVIGRLNINELAHPAAIWYSGISRGRYRHQTTIAGRKPFKGYTTWADIITRSSLYSEGSNTPYQANFWYENQFADASTDHRRPARVVLDVRTASLVVTSGNSPVYTLYVTAQSLDDDGKPLAEIKVHLTVERTWDGKTNLLDFKWIP